MYRTTKKHDWGRMLKLCLRGVEIFEKSKRKGKVVINDIYRLLAVANDTHTTW